MSQKIIYVYSPAGPPLDYCFPKIAARAEVYTCMLSEASVFNLGILHQYSTQLFDFTSMNSSEALTRVRELAIELRPDAIFTFSEFLLKAVSEIASDMGLKGVGPQVDLARNKLAMRECWAKANIPQPRFCAIRSLDDISNIADLTFPIIIKLAYGTGSIAQQVVYHHDDIFSSLDKILCATQAARRIGKHEYSEAEGFPLLIAEELIVSTTDSWYEVEGYGDYLSVEGLVKDGVYYPLAMTGRLPTVPPFTELGNVAPCMISNDRKEFIVNIVRQSIDALKFENCATHTEVKLMADGGISFLETAARIGGVAIAKELDEVFGIDYIDLFLSTLLGYELSIPSFEENLPRCAAASVALIGCDVTGKPWAHPRRFLPDQVDWNALVGGMADVEVQMAQSLAPGSRVQVYDTSGGIMNYAGQAFLRSEHPIQLKQAAHLLINSFEHHLPVFASDEVGVC